MDGLSSFSSNPPRVEGRLKEDRCLEGELLRSGLWKSGLEKCELKKSEPCGVPMELVERFFLLVLHQW